MISFPLETSPWWFMVITHHRFSEGDSRSCKMNIIVKPIVKMSIMFDLHVVLMDLDWFRLTLIRWLFCIGHMKSFSSHRRTFPLNLNHKYFIQWNCSRSPSVSWSTFSNQILCTTCVGSAHTKLANKRQTPNQKNHKNFSGFWQLLKCLHFFAIVAHPKRKLFRS